MDNGFKQMRDVIVVGGGAAGLSAAMMLARSRRSVVVVDAGFPRNAPADGVHGLLARDGMSPLELLARGREEARGYGADIVDGEVIEVSHAPDGFTVTLRSGEVLHGPRLLIATGLVDELPDIPGVRERWGRDVLHCPYCHGWEVRDRRIGVIASGPTSVHQALMFRQLSDRVTFFAQDHELDAGERAKFDALGIAVITGDVAAVELQDDRMRGVRLADRTLADVEVVVVAPRMVARSELFAGIGIQATAHPAGAFIETDEFGATSVPGVWAAGNSSDLSAQVGAAAAAGARAAQHINAVMVMDDADRAVARQVTTSAVSQ
ncbi:NAD(P)/FAD-dependent oxidoreductase [Arthrobacter sp. NPDC056727]|uniref:NAD(P)/FAD-dependent oxidoreductase n=1 Tax=Arthrobacter sp. NPDC056727 TaxID=3345927 RepID=UPI00367263C5